MAAGPQQLLEVCGQRLSRFLCDAQHKHLAWLREVEEQGMRMLKRLSRRRSGVKLLSSSLNSQQCLSQEQPRSPGCEGQDVSVPGCAVGSQTGIAPQLPALPGKQPVEALVPLADLDCQECPQGAAGGDAAPPAVLGGQLPEGDAAAELQEVPGVPGIPAEHPGRDGEQDARRASTSTPKTARNDGPAALQGDGSPQGPETLPFQDSPSKSATEKSRMRRRSGLGAPRKSHRASLAEKCSLASRRENMIRRSIGRAMARKAAARESSSASSRVSCQSSLEAFVEEDVTSGTRLPELSLLQAQVPELPALLHSKCPLWSSRQGMLQAVRPLRNILQGQGSGIKDFLKRNTPTRLHLKEKERQRLENLRKKQEAEEQRKKKVEEEKRRRQAEMKQKREERLRKALQARERAEQMEEKKKKRVEQKILQSDEKVHISQVREEKVAEERSKRKGSKKHGEAEARKQKALKWEENEQQEPLPKREDEVKERGKTVLELKNLLEQKQLGQVKEKCELVPVLEDPKQRGKEKPLQAQQEPAAVAGKTTKEAEGEQQPGEEKKPIQPAAPGTWPNKAVKKSLSTSCLGSLKEPEPESPPADENSYGLDLNSDDSTDDESNPRKPVPAWADGAQLQEAIVRQYYQPVDVDALFGAIPSPRLEHIFYKSKPRYFKRTSSAVWHSPPGPSCGPSCTFQS
ncbi:hypothetical protein DUI87_25429 [Hirundo rustica rustica]|uniref:Inner centromere protein ARK-binding domain-containing protein n=1 Tax=Hirundo rustica rustica TaxID=333673 RepID=A0A3M0J9V5_HIRRU|nr:hypothetical protein DUI87_25429 [Hirundo rustica rustica]